MNDLLCQGCGLRIIHCVCDLMEPVPARTRVLVIRHAAERYKSSNTGILLSRLLPDCRVMDHGRRESPLDPELLLSPNLVLVYPGEPGPPLPPNPTLVILDGSWPQVRKMYHRIPGASSLPCLPLPPPVPRLRMRQSPLTEGMSTLEAAAAALSIVEDPALAPPLLRLYDRMTERQLRQRGRIPQANFGIEGLPA